MIVEPYDDEIMTWHYDPSYDFYDTEADPPEDPAKFRVVRGEDGRVEPFRLFVADWNARAIALYERLGFREVGERHVRSFERFGDHVFLRMESAA